MSDVLHAVAAFGLPSAEQWSSRPLEVSDWRDLARRVREERIEGLLMAAVEGGAFPVADEQLDDVRMLARGRAKLDIAIEREMLRVSERLRAKGIAYRLLKGPAHAHRYFPDPTWRGFGDVDILVRPRDWYGAIALMREYGARRPVPEVRPGFDQRFGKEATFFAPSGVEIDLHRALVVGPYGLWADVDTLFGSPGHFIGVAGQQVPVLETESAFLHACYNAALGDDPPRLAALRDVAQIAIKAQPDVAEVASLAARWRGTSVVSRAIRLVRVHLGVDLRVTPIGRHFEAVQVPALHRALIRTYLGVGRGYRSQLAAVVAVKGVRNRAAYLGSLARPQRDYLQARGWSGPQWVRHAAGRVMSRR